MFGDYSRNQKVFGHHVSTLENVSVEDMMPPQLKTNIENIELSKTQELVRSTHKFKNAKKG